jgi:ABC-type multidrug transport system fused ATPase/permease subunit
MPPPVEIGEIEFDHVEFAYPTDPDRPVLRKLSMKFLKNKFNAIVGLTGAGKSTIVQLLLKMHLPSKGRILVGGRDLAEVDAGWFRDRVGYV